MKVCKINQGKKKFYMLLLGFQIVLILSVVLSVNTIEGVAQDTVTEAATNVQDVVKWIALSSALSVGLSVLGAGYAIKTTGTAAISTLSENPDQFFKGFLVVALGEALAVYGLIVAILLWTKIPDLTILIE